MRCTYWSSSNEALKAESKLDEDQQQEIVDREADAMQQFFLANHSRLDNLADDDSAESAPEGPHVDAARTE